MAMPERSKSPFNPAERDLIRLEMGCALGSIPSWPTACSCAPGAAARTRASRRSRKPSRVCSTAAWSRSGPIRWGGRRPSSRKLVWKRYGSSCRTAGPWTRSGSRICGRSLGWNPGPAARPETTGHLWERPRSPPTCSPLCVGAPSCSAAGSLQCGFCAVLESSCLLFCKAQPRQYELNLSLFKFATWATFALAKSRPSPPPGLCSPTLQFHPSSASDGH